jgi:rhodanese-related sulfurtransferase
MTKWRFRVLYSLLPLVLALAGCRAGGAVTTPAPGAAALQTQKVPVEGGGSYTDVNAAGLAAMLEDKDFPLINVHVPYEGEIPDTDLFIPYNGVEANLGQLPLDNGAKLVLYCRSGGMSAIAARTLVKLGYTDVWNLDGGMIGWEQAGYPLLYEAQ